MTKTEVMVKVNGHFKRKECNVVYSEKTNGLAYNKSDINPIIIAKK